MQLFRTMTGASVACPRWWPMPYSGPILPPVTVMNSLLNWREPPVPLPMTRTWRTSLRVVQAPASSTR